MRSASFLTPLAAILTSIVTLTASGCAADAGSNESAASSSDELNAFATPADVAAIDGEVLDLKVDARDVFALVRRTSTYVVERISKATSAATTVLTLPESRVSGFAMDDTSVYLLDNTQEGARIVRGSKLGGAPTVIASGRPRAFGLEADAMHVYFVENLEGAKAIARAPKSGIGGVEVVATTSMNLVSFALDDGAVYWVDSGPGNPAIGCNAHEGVIYKQAKRPGSRPQPVVTGETCPLQISVDNGRLYYSTLFGAVRTVSTAGGIPIVAVANIDSGHGFDVSGGSVAFIRATDSQHDLTRTLTIGRKSPLGLVPTLHVKTQTELSHDPPTGLGALAVDATTTYYVVNSARAIGVHPSGDTMWSATGTLKKISAL